MSIIPPKHKHPSPALLLFSRSHPPLNSVHHFTPLQVLTYHYYCWFANAGNDSKPYSNLTKAECDGADGLGRDVYKAIEKDKRQLRVPVFMSEWGGKTPRASQAHARSFVEVSKVSFIF